MCAVTLPVALDGAGMPVGLHIVARGGEEETALALRARLRACAGPSRASVSERPENVPEPERRSP